MFSGMPFWQLVGSEDFVGLVDNTDPDWKKHPQDEQRIHISSQRKEASTPCRE